MFNSSIKYFQKSIAIEAENSEAYFGLGLAYKSKDDLQHSKGYLQKAYELEPKNANAFSQAYNVASLVCDWSSTEKLKRSYTQFNLPLVGSCKKLGNKFLGP